MHNTHVRSHNSKLQRMLSSFAAKWGTSRILTSCRA